MFVTNTPAPLGTYPAARSQSVMVQTTRLWVEVDDDVDLEVHVNGSPVYSDTLTAGAHSIALPLTIAAGATVAFVLTAGAPHWLWAQIDEGTP